MTIFAGVAAFNAFASAVAGGPTWWTVTWLVALMVAVLLMVGRLVRGA
jgi:hypothetical protein